MPSICSTGRVRARRLVAGVGTLLLLCAFNALAVDEDDESADEPIVSEYSERVVVTASRTEEPVFEAPVAITVIDESQIRTSGAEGYAGLLRGVPGLNTIQTGARDVSFSARDSVGLGENRLLVLVDGRSTYMDHQGIVMYDAFSFDFDELAQVEVVHGPGSVMWGANALAGVVNFRTKTPRELEGASFKLGAGERDTRYGSVRVARGFDKLSYKLSASYYSQEPWDRDPNLAGGAPVPAEFLFANQGTRQPKFDARLDYEPGNGTVWSYRAGYAGVDGLTLQGLGPVELEDDFYHAYARVSRKTRKTNAKIYWNRFEGVGVNVYTPAPLDTKGDSFVAEITARSDPGERHRLVYGGNLRRSEFTLTPAPNNEPREEAGVFLEDTIDVNAKLRTVLGARVDWFDTIGATVSPRVSLIVKPVPTHALRLTYNRAYRSPTQLENYLDVPALTPIVLDPMLPPFILQSQVVGDPDLKEEYVDAYELGYTVLFGARVMFTTALYRNEIRDNVQFFNAEFYSESDPPPGWPLPPALVPPMTLPKTATARNIAEVTNQGAELSLNMYHSNGWASVFSYTYQDEPEIEDNDPSEPVVLNTPSRHQASLSVRHDGPRYFGSATVSYVDEAFWRDILSSAFWGPTESHTVVDVAWARRFEGPATLVFRVSNLFDEPFKQHAFGDVIGRRAAVELRLDWD